MSKRKVYVFEPEGGGDRVTVTREVGVLDCEYPPMDLWSFEGSFSWKEIAALANHIRRKERGEVSAIDVAEASRGGELREPTDDDRFLLDIME